MNETTTDQAPEQSVEERLADKFFGPADKADEPQAHADDADEAEDDQTDDQAEQSPGVEEVEIEHENWKGKIPAKLKAELDKGADYTRKTQEVAEQRRLVEAQQRIQQEEQAFYQSAAKEYQQLQQIEAQLEQYRTVDLSQVDGESLSRMSMAAANLREERAKLKEGLDSKRGQFKKQMVAQWDEMAQRATQAMTTIPNWKAVAPQVAEWAINEGFPFEFITGYDRQTRERVGPGVVDPTFAKSLYKAWQWDQLQASKPAAQQKVNKAAPVLKPGAVDARSMKQVEHMNFRKAMKNAPTDSRKAELIGDRLARKFNF